MSLNQLATKVKLGAWSKTKLIIDYERKSFRKDLLFVCSIGLNIGFILGILYIL